MDELRVLLVEDEAIIAMDLANRLERLGHTVVDVVGSGSDAIRKADAHRPDLIIMDIELQGQMSGVEAAKIIRAGLDVSVIFMSAYSPKQISTADCANEIFVAKPIEEAAFRASIARAMRERDSG